MGLTRLANDFGPQKFVDFGARVPGFGEEFTCMLALERRRQLHSEFVTPELVRHVELPDLPSLRVRYFHDYVPRHRLEAGEHPVKGVDFPARDPGLHTL